MRSCTMRLRTRAVCLACETLKRTSGEEVATIVEGCTDSFEEDANKKQEWEQRKASYIERLKKEPQGVLLVSVADKLYNARAILQDYREVAGEIWKQLQRERNEAILVFRRSF